MTSVRWANILFSFASDVPLHRGWLGFRLNSIVWTIEVLQAQLLRSRLVCQECWSSQRTEYSRSQRSTFWKRFQSAAGGSCVSSSAGTHSRRARIGTIRTRYHRFAAGTLLAEVLVRDPGQRIAGAEKNHRVSGLEDRPDR